MPVPATRASNDDMVAAGRTATPEEFVTSLIPLAVMVTFGIGRPSGVETRKRYTAFAG